jgi:hypothetical protein
MIRVLVLNSILSNLVPFFCLGGAGLPVAYQFIILFVQLDYCRCSRFGMFDFQQNLP